MLSNLSFRERDRDYDPRQWPWPWLWPTTVTVTVTMTHDSDRDRDYDPRQWPWPWPGSQVTCHGSGEPPSSDLNYEIFASWIRIHTYMYTYRGSFERSESWDIWHASWDFIEYTYLLGNYREAHILREALNVCMRVCVHVHMCIRVCMYIS
jgi:hypothetical protein